MGKKTIIIIVIFVALCGGSYFLGRHHSNADTGTVDQSTELYQDTITEIEKLRSELAGYTELIQQLEPGLTEAAERIEASQIRVESSIGISGDIAEGSGEIGNLARELRSDITDIGEASRGLAELFGVETEGSGPATGGP